MEVGQIIKVTFDNWFAHGRVISINEAGEAKVGFKVGTHYHVATVLPEMVVEAFWQDGTWRYGV